MCAGPSKRPLGADLTTMTRPLGAATPFAGEATAARWAPHDPATLALVTESSRACRILKLDFKEGLWLDHSWHSADAFQTGESIGETQGGPRPEGRGEVERSSLWGKGKGSRQKPQGCEGVGRGSGPALPVCLLPAAK